MWGYGKLGGKTAIAGQTVLNKHPGVKRLVFFADQFEELFALNAEAAQTRFMTELLALLNSSLPLTFILTLRADFYGNFLSYKALKPHLDTGRVDVYPMEQEELQSTVKKPARKVSKSQGSTLRLSRLPRRATARLRPYNLERIRLFGLFHYKRQIDLIAFGVFNDNNVVS